MPLLIAKILSQKNESIENLLSQQERIYTFLNPVSYLDAMIHKELFAKFDGIFADGSLLVAAILLLYGRKVIRRSFDMTSLAPQLFDCVCRENKSIYIVASTSEAVEKAVDIIRECYQGINICGFRNGYFSDELEERKTINDIVEMNPDFLIVGMGAIKQEEFLVRVKNAGYHGIGFTCGGFIHQLAMNEINYYPKWIDKYNLRFLYRMYKEPHTRKRYLKAGVLFPICFLWERIRMR